MALYSLMLVCFITASFLDQCNGFAPYYLATVGASTTDSMDHEEITEAAVLSVLRDYLLDNPNRAVDSTSVISSLEDPSASSLFGAYYHGTTRCISGLHIRCIFTYLSYKSAVDTIADANSEVDDGESLLPSAHFDNEEIPEGNKRLQVIKQAVVNHIRREAYEEARTQTGRALHTLQDFYSHSNWVELENTEPLANLGRPGYVPTSLAGEDVTTCTSCPRGDDVSIILRLFGGSRIQVDHEYDCTDNLAQDIQSRNILTTGYYGHVPESASKPQGKCSHGGASDITGTFNPEGGINKDLKTNTFSPHHYLHDEAADVALKATVLFLQDIRSAVGDAAFAAFLNIEQIRSSVAFVIDTTGSMGEEILEIQNSIPSIRRDLENYQASLGGGVTVDYILVPFNDPDTGIIQTTQNISTLLGYIEQLTAAGGGGDCREPSIGAIIRAARNSQEGGVINVYTDAPPSDENRLPESESIIKDKNLVVNTFLTPGVCSRTLKRYADKKRLKRQAASDPFQFLSSISGGQLLEVLENDLSKVQSVVFSSFKPTTSTIFYQAGSSGFSGTVEFPVDSTLTEVLITVNGDDLQIGLTSPQGQDATALSIVEVSLSSSSTYLATVNVSDSSLYGMWQLNFTSSSSYRVFISGDSDLLFGYTLYRGDNTTKSGLKAIRQKALQGEPLLLVIQLDEELETATVTTANIINSEGLRTGSVNLTSGGDGYYYGVFEVPSSSFQLEISGLDSGGYAFTRISDTGEDTTDIQVVLGLGDTPYLVLRTGDNQTLSLLAKNFGPSSTFTVEVASSTNSSGFIYYLSDQTTSQTVALERGESSSISLEILAMGTITEANSLSLIVTMFDIDSVERSNFLNIEVTGTTVPPVNRSEIEFYNGSKGLDVVLSYMMILLSSLILGFLL